MGAQCCSQVKPGGLQQLGKKLEQQYLEATWPQQDQYLSEYFKAHQQFKNELPKKHCDFNSYYAGQWKQGIPSGQGMLYQPNRYLYEGTFKNGVPQGQGKIHYIVSNCRYQGQVKDGSAYGMGKFYNDINKYVFQGQWQNSVPKRGKVTFQQGTTIQIEDYNQGKAVINYKDGKQYTGAIHQKKYVPHGQGSVRFTDGSWYIGSWQDGKMHGHGVFIWRILKDNQYKQQKYDGWYFQGKKQGEGTFYFASGNHYQGNWENGKQNGKGVLYDTQNKPIKQGIWQNGVFMKKAPVLYMNQSQIPANQDHLGQNQPQ